MLFRSQYHLYVSPYTLDFTAIKTTTTMNQKSTKEMEQHTKSLVIFGATGDLCRRKLIPALFSLHEKNLLPEDFRIIGASRTAHTRQSWLESLGRYYPADFSLKLEYYACLYENFPCELKVNDINQILIDEKIDVHIYILDIWIIEGNKRFIKPSVTWLPLHFTPVEESTINALGNFHSYLYLSTFGLNLGHIF